jgi:anti-anti-sigma factor
LPSVSKTLGVAAYSWPNGQHVLRLVGVLDNTNVTRLLQEMTRLDLREGHRLSVHLEDLAFIDSTGVTGLLDTEAFARARGCEFEVATTSVQARSVMELVGLDRLLPSIDDEPVDPARVLPLTSTG